MKRASITPAKNKRVKTQGNAPIRTAGSSLVRPVRVYAGHQPFAKQRHCTLKYVTTDSIALSGGIADHQFSANGLFQPNVTSADHQPLYFDELMAVYTNYIVKESRIRLTPLNAAGGIPYVATIVKNESSTGFVNFIQAAEQATSSYVIKYDANTSVTQASTRNSYNLEATHGKVQLKSDFSGSATANPAQIERYHCVFAGVGGTTQTVNFMVEIEYDVVFTDMAVIAQS